MMSSLETEHKPVPQPEGIRYRAEICLANLALDLNDVHADGHDPALRSLLAATESVPIGHVICDCCGFTLHVSPHSLVFDAL